MEGFWSIMLFFGLIAVLEFGASRRWRVVGVLIAGLMTYYLLTVAVLLAFQPPSFWDASLPAAGHTVPYGLALLLGGMVCGYLDAPPRFLGGLWLGFRFGLLACTVNYLTILLPSLRYSSVKPEPSALRLLTEFAIGVAVAAGGCLVATPFGNRRRRRQEEAKMVAEEWLRRDMAREDIEEELRERWRLEQEMRQAESSRRREDGTLRDAQEDRFRRAARARPRYFYAGKPIGEDFYRVLRVSPHDGQDAIERAYKKMMKQSHPDLGGDTERAQLINEAYEVLGHHVSRRQYDRENP